MNEKKLVFDIETFKNPNLHDDYMEWKLGDLVNKTLKDPIKIKADMEKKSGKFALDARTGQIIHIGCLFVNVGEILLPENTPVLETELAGNPVKKVEFRLNDYDSEKAMLLAFLPAFFKAIDEGTQLISFGGKRFDIPYIRERAILNYIANPGIVRLSQLTYQYENQLHCDLENFVSGGGLAEWNYLLTGEGSPQNDGANIGTYYLEGDYDVIAMKCEQDLVRTYKFFKGAESWL